MHKFLTATVVAAALTASLANQAGAIRPAEHSAPSVEDKHAAEADEKTAIEVRTTSASMSSLLSPYSQAWTSAPATSIPLFPQSLVAPVGGGSVKQVDARALRTGQGIAFRLEWSDSTQDNGKKDSKFKDAAAIEFPIEESGDTRLAMGHATSPVNILYWSADNSATKKAGNSQVEELVAGGVYSRGRKDAKYQLLQCQSNWRTQKWAVVIFKPFNEADIASPKFAQGSELPMALAVWNGSAGERLGIKSLSGWNLLRIK